MYIKTNILNKIIAFRSMSRHRKDAKIVFTTLKFNKSIDFFCVL